MNSYSFDELDIGREESFAVTVTEEMMADFLKITGDVNPLHNNEDFAKRKGFDSRVVYGMLTASFFSTLAGVYIPGEKCLIEEVNYKFTKPVYIGDELTVSGKISERDNRVKQLVLKVRIKRKSDDATVIRGSMTVGVLE